MKKIIFAIFATLCITNFAIGQAVLETSYVSGKWQYQETNSFKTDSGINYYTFNDVTNVMLIYNSAHSLIKTVNVPVDAGYYVNYFYAVSDKLFNTDSNIEFVVALAQNSGSLRKLTLISETGSVLQQFGNKTGLNIIKTPTGQFKMATYLSPSGTQATFNIDIYSLPGTFLNLNSNRMISNLITIYPNPSANRININHNIEIGTEINLEIYDILGKKKIEKKIISNSEDISVNVDLLEVGTYIVRLNDEQVKFIKK